MTKLEYLKRALELRAPAVCLAAMAEGWDPDLSKPVSVLTEESRAYIEGAIARMEAGNGHGNNQA